MNVKDILKKENLLNININTKQTNIQTDDIVGISFYSANYFKKTKQNLIILTPNLYDALNIRDVLYCILNKEDIIYLPCDDSLTIEYLASSKEIIADRIYGIYRIINLKKEKPKIIIMNLTTALRFYPSLNDFKNSILSMKKNDVLNIKDLKYKLLKFGFENVNKIEKTGDFSIRGSIIDIFPLNLDNPIRIDLFDDTIETIKYFDIETQLSNTEIIEVEICPNIDFFFSNLELENKIINFKEELISENNLNKNKEKNIRIINEDLDNITNNIYFQNYYKYFYRLSSEKNNIFDYFDKSNTNVIYSNYSNIIFLKDKLLNDEVEYKNNLKENNLYFNDIKFYLDTIFDSKFNRIRNLIYEENKDILKFEITKPSFNSINKDSIIYNLNLLIKNDYKIYLCFDYQQQQNFFISTILSLTKKEELLKKLSFAIDNLKLGIDFKKEKIIILTSKELFNYKNNINRYVSRFKESAIIKNYQDLKIGDFVVHEKYGIAKYAGIEIIKSADVTNDFIKLIFANEDFLYIPLEQFNIIRKYVSKEGYTPKLSKLFSKSWENTKRKIKENIEDLSLKLLDLYKDQLNLKRQPYLKDDEFQFEFEQRFPFDLTKDQNQTMIDIKNDMESNIPMNRLICGDVGFGKTEIAFRAAFKAINSGKQVCFMCPTTILAKQHYERAIERFSGFDIKICLMTRNLTSYQFNRNIINIQNGTIHFVIGTHKVLNNKIQFKELGLLIIDEEQRFGVEQKEKIIIENKKIDILTLSATPIPRTLQMSLSGMKSISLINSPPINRTPIQTFLIPYDEKILNEIISRELFRKGQIYYLHNEIFNIYEKANNIAKRFPLANIGVIHGKLEKEEIDNVMNEFYLGNIDILVTTTIIENGIDVPNANLIIIENANNFGLAQLYQLKGRVGRSNTLSFAYLTYNSKKELNEDAKKRLKTIKEFTELGSGYKIAQRDLLIRGSGDILGSNQSGNINDIGIDLYLKLLNEQINKIRNKEFKTNEIEEKKISISGYIPNSYAKESNKVEIYSLIDNSTILDELDNAVLKIIDIYGKIPNEFINIIELKKLKIKLKNLIFYDIDDQKDLIIIKLSKEFSQIDGIGFKLFNELLPYKENIKILYTNGLLKITFYKNINNWLNLLNNLVDELIKLYNENNEIG